MAAASRSGGVVQEVAKLSVEQLQAVKEQIDAELSVLQDSVGSIRTAANRFEMAASALNNLSLQKEGQQMLVPLTASLYVPGVLENVDNVLVDVGTGYFIEKSLPEGKDYCDRKINFLKANHDKLVEVASEKRSAAEQVSLVLQAKMRSSAAPSEQ
ncbi:prefoldin alpha subunit [Marchantia polymorpha subsp. ruderalis]|uniref:Prefoldin subunit 5 n=2 Tax=Marchantia polymorpha TaxID=3197 RepID=A0A176W183_MARPO|nr:hypothetical protein AXG93_215s1220 [Marchantia polymorpha subsp. ruderalis]PTQ40104.1 hypothetical protein MARPO_0041s0007 [Marchantia polymorpha]BBN09116.1 hypothetical protein Mp_4g17250 [Marchantia polymorpha subsp. ruderalis]|eukprot:PTQ40104.1 hypothetical protein MARPO_0041s0007 [Marchantia polymorpha]